MGNPRFEPITREGFADELDALERRWGKLHAGFSDAAEAYLWFQHYPRHAFTIAIKLIFEEGRQSPPSPSLILKHVKAWAAEHGTFFSEPQGPCDHPNAAILERRDGKRDLICITCREEWTAPEAQYLCDAERDDLAPAEAPF